MMEKRQRSKGEIEIIKRYNGIFSRMSRYGEEKLQRISYKEILETFTPLYVCKKIYSKLKEMGATWTIHTQRLERLEKAHDDRLNYLREQYWKEKKIFRSTAPNLFALDEPRENYSGGRK